MSERTETVNLNVSIAGRNYPLRVLKTDEQTMLSAVDKINGKLNEYQQTFAGKDKVDYLAMW